MKDNDRMMIKKIVGYIDDITDFVSNLDFDCFLSDRKTISACAFTISLIGEIAGDVSDELKKSTPTIPWKSVRGMRNKIVHDYEGIDYSVLWGTISNSLPVLREQLTHFIENE